MSDVQVKTSGGPGRCAYCHDDVRIEERAACAACLAVHHADCFARDGKCASCGEARLLAAAGSVAPSGDPALAALGREMILTCDRAARRAIANSDPALRAARRLHLGIHIALTVLVAPAAATQQFALIGALIAAIVINVVFLLTRYVSPVRAKLRALQAELRRSETRSPAKEPPL